MLVTHIYLNGHCREAIDLYVKAFGGVIIMIIPEPGREHLVAHAEIKIHGQRLMMNDFGGHDGSMRSAGYQLVIIFESENELKAAYSAMEQGSTTIYPMATTDYSACVVRFIDRFDVRWAFMVS